MRQKILLKGIMLISIILSVFLCVLIYGFYAQSGSLTPPPGALNSTMFSFSDIGGSGFSSSSHSLKAISGDKIGVATDAASMATTLFAGQQYLWDNRASFGTVGGGDATLANQTTILGRIGTNTDAASMSDTLFAGQQYLWDNRASFGTASGDATLANQTTILGRIGAATDAANIDTTLFAGQQYIWDNRSSFGHQTPLGSSFNGNTATCSGDTCSVTATCNSGTVIIAAWGSMGGVGGCTSVGGLTFNSDFTKLRPSCLGANSCVLGGYNGNSGACLSIICAK